MAHTHSTVSVSFDTYSGIVRRVLVSLQGHTPFGLKIEDFHGVAWLAYKKAHGEIASVTGGQGSHEIEAQIFTRVRRAVIDEIRRLLPLSTRTQQRHRLVMDSRQRLEGPGGEEPSIDAIADASGLSRDATRRALAAGSFACPEQLDNHFDVQDSNPDAAEATDTIDRCAILRGALQTLPWQQRRVLVGLFYDQEPPAEIAKALRVTINRVYQIRDAGLSKLRLKKGVSELAP